MENHVIIVAGLAGSGKSTLVENLAKEFNLRPVFASGILHAMREEELKNIKVSEVSHGKGWWESKEGKEYLEERMKDPSMDKKLDEKLLEIIEEGNVVVDSWTMPWLSKKGFKIWLEVSVEERARRVAERDQLPLEEVIIAIRNRTEKTAEIYRKIYGFELGKDFAPFDFVLHSDNFTQEETFEKVKKEIEEKYLNSP